MQPKRAGVIGRVAITNRLEIAPLPHHHRTQHGDASSSDGLAPFVEDASDDCAGARERHVHVDLLAVTEHHGLRRAERSRLTKLPADIAIARHRQLPGTGVEVAHFELTAIVRNHFTWESDRTGDGDDRLSERSTRVSRRHSADDGGASGGWAR